MDRMRFPFAFCAVRPPSFQIGLPLTLALRLLCAALLVGNAAAAVADSSPSPWQLPSAGQPPRTIEAESFHRGNVRIDTAHWGAGIGVAYARSTAGNETSFTEYLVQADQAGFYQINLRCAARQSRRMSLLLDGRIAREVHLAPSRSLRPADQRWFAISTVYLDRGVHTVRFEAKGRWPLVDKLRVLRSTDALQVEAEDFSRGNPSVQSIDAKNAVIRSGAGTSAFAEYKIAVERGGLYQLHLRGDLRGPLDGTISVNGKLVSRSIRPQQDRRTFERVETPAATLPEMGRWRPSVSMQLAAGENRLRLTARWQLLPLDRYALVELETDDRLTLAMDANTSLPEGPWQSDGKPRSLEQYAFRDVDRPEHQLTLSKFYQWLQPLPGQSFRANVSRNQYGKVINFAGAARFRAPWRPGASLLITAFTTGSFQLELFNGVEGVELDYIGSQHRWAAYRIGRLSGQAIELGGATLQLADAKRELLTTDDGRAARSVSGSYAIRYQDQQLIVTRGDVRLISVPLDAPPTDIQLRSEGMIFRELAMVDTRPLLPESVEESPAVVETSRPADLGWKPQLPPSAAVRTSLDGRLQLANDSEAEVAELHLPLLRTGIYEWVFHFDDVSPGAAVLLADAAGESRCGVQFVPGSAGKVRMQLYVDGKNVDFPVGPATPFPAADVTGDLWLKMSVAGGRLQCWISGEGRHWGRFAPPTKLPPAMRRTLVLQCGGAPTGARIGLRSLGVKKLGALTGLAAVDLVERAASAGFGHAALVDTSYGAWERRVLQQMPGDVDLPTWKRACGVATLAGAVDSQLAAEILHDFASQAARGSAAVDDPLRLLADVAVLVDTGEKARFERLRRHYDHLVDQWMQNRVPDAYRRARAGMMRAGYFHADLRPALPDFRLARQEMFNVLANDRTDALLPLCRRLRFWHRPPQLAARWLGEQGHDDEFVTWAEVNADRERTDRSSLIAKRGWAHPIEVEVSKEAFNTLAEVQVALADGAFNDACRLLAGAVGREGLGLLPDLGDRQLHGSLPAAVHRASDLHPELKQAMHAEFGDVARLRVQQAASRADLELLQNATVRYFGTEAAAAAHLWLGNRSLTAGRFSDALHHLRRAQATGPARLLPQINARIRLTAAMLGHVAGSAPMEKLAFGDVELPPDAFESMVAAIRRRHGGTQREARPFPPQAASRSCEVRDIAMLDGDMGKGQMHHQLDWAGRQLATLGHGDSVLVSNRFQVVCYDAVEGSVRWSFGLAGRQGGQSGWPLISMQPSVEGNRVFARLLADSGPEIVCLDLETGEQQWTSEKCGLVISDPLLIDGQLRILTVQSGATHYNSQIALTALDARTGRLRRHWPLVTLRRSWSHSEHGCRAVVAEGHIYAVVAGSLLCCDPHGQVSWLRKELWLPGQLMSQTRRPQRPLVAGGRVFAAAAQSGSVACLDSSTGRAIWHIGPPGPVRIISATEDRLLVQTAQGIEAVAVDDGRPLWHFREPRLLDGFAVSANPGLFCLAARQCGPKLEMPWLLRLDVETGRIRDRWPLTSLSREKLAIGPLVRAGDRLWAMVGRFDKDRLQPQREIFALAPKSVARDDGQGARLGLAPAESPVVQAAEIVIPGWKLLESEFDDRTGLQPGGEGRQPLLVTAAAKNPVCFARRITAEKTNAKLLVDVAAEGNQRGTVRVLAGPHLVSSFEPPARNGEQKWQPTAVDLSALVGQTVWLTVIHEAPGENSVHATWRGLDVQP